MPNLRHRLIVLLVSGALAPACGGEEPLDLDRRPAADAGGDAGPPADAGEHVPDEIVTDGGEPIPLRIDREAFRTVVMPILDRRCGTAACHARPHVKPDHLFQLYASPDHPIEDLTAHQWEENLRETVDFVDFLHPDASDLLRFPLSDASHDPPHPTPSPVLLAGGEEVTALRDWIVSATRPPEPDAGPPDAGPPLPRDVPCAALPSPERVRGAAWFEAFRDDVSPMLTETCAGADCHGTPANGGGLWLRLPETHCDVTWNFLAVQWYIDPTSPVESLLLRKPLDRNHGGREVFRGTSDPRYTLLKDWVLDGLEPPPEPHP